MKLFRMLLSMRVLLTHQTSYNPICCCHVEATGDQDCLYIDVIPCLEDGVDAVGGRIAATTGGLQAQLLASVTVPFEPNSTRTTGATNKSNC